MLLHFVPNAHSLFVIFLSNTDLELTLQPEDFVTNPKHDLNIRSNLRKFLIILAFVSLYPKLLHIFESLPRILINWRVSERIALLDLIKAPLLGWRGEGHSHLQQDSVHFVTHLPLQYRRLEIIDTNAHWLPINLNESQSDLPGQVAMNPLGLLCENNFKIAPNSKKWELSRVLIDNVHTRARMPVYALGKAARDAISRVEFTMRDAPILLGGD